MKDNWVSIEEGYDALNTLAKTNVRVLTYSPVYEGKDSTMLYRLMDPQFVKLCKEVTHWCVPTPPK